MDSVSTLPRLPFTQSAGGGWALPPRRVSLLLLWLAGQEVDDRGPSDAAREEAAARETFSEVARLGGQRGAPARRVRATMARGLLCVKWVAVVLGLAVLPRVAAAGEPEPRWWLRLRREAGVVARIAVVTEAAMAVDIGRYRLGPRRGARRGRRRCA